MTMELFEQIAGEDIAIAPKELASLFKALAHPKRLAILQSLRGAERCVCEIEDALDLRQAYVSQQLTVLREAGLVCYRRDGWNVYYRIARPEVYTLMELAAAIYSDLGTCATLDPESEWAAGCGCPDSPGDSCGASDCAPGTSGESCSELEIGE